MYSVCTFFKGEHTMSTNRKLVLLALMAIVLFLTLISCEVRQTPKSG